MDTNESVILRVSWTSCLEWVRGQLISRPCQQFFMFDASHRMPQAFIWQVSLVMFNVLAWQVLRVNGKFQYALPPFFLNFSIANLFADFEQVSPSMKAAVAAV